MNIGTKSILFGVHQFAIHPWFVALAWWRLYGFPFDPRLWVAFFLHDLGYWGKPNMDGPEGETHPIWAAMKMLKWFGPEWMAFVRYHSRYLAKRDGQPYSRLCVADKLATGTTPRLLFLVLGNLSGEIYEYMIGKGSRTQAVGHSQWQWITKVRAYNRAWALEHRDGRLDTWTGSARTFGKKP